MRRKIVEEWRADLLYLIQVSETMQVLAMDLRISESALYRLRSAISDENYNPNKLTEESISELAARRRADKESEGVEK